MNVGFRFYQGLQVLRVFLDLGFSSMKWLDDLATWLQDLESRMSLLAPSN